MFIPKKIKAAILAEQRKPLIIADIYLPANLNYGQVLVKIFYSGICGAQINEIDGVKGSDHYLPHLLGHEGTGEVIKCGEGVSAVKKGDYVVLHWRKGEGIQSATPGYLWKGKKVNAGWVTTFNEMAVVSENRITPIPKDTDLATAALYGCTLTTAFGVIHHDAQLKSGESIVVFGAGGVGSAIVLAASTSGAYPIIAVDISVSKLQGVKNLGANHTLIYKEKSIREDLEKILGRLGADVTIDTTGINRVREICFESANKKGRTVLVGVPKHGEKMSIDSFPLHFQKILTGSEGGSCNPSYDIPRLIRLFKAKNFNLHKMISRIYTLDNINEAVTRIRTGTELRCLIKVNNITIPSR